MDECLQSFGRRASDFQLYWQFLQEEGAKEKLYSYVQAVNVKDAKGLQTVLVEDA